MKKFLIPLALSTLILFGLPVLAHEGTHTFGDVGDTHLNMPAIEYLVSIGTLQGYDDGTFKPDNTVNRAEIMKILVKGQGIDPDPAIFNHCFPDVNDEWFAASICYAKAQDWVSGYPDGNFKPANTVNKVEAVKMLINALGLDNRLPASVNETLFNDTDSTAWYAPYLKVAKELNLLEIASDNFTPIGGMNRAGISENIFRTLIVKDNDLSPYSTTDRNTFLTAGGQGSLVGIDETEEISMNDTTADVDMEEDTAPSIPAPSIQSFELTARQWEFEPGTLTVKQGDTVHLTITSTDVSHGFYLPAFNVSETLIPGETVRVEFVADQKGTFTFSCNVFCGSGHSHMNGTLVVE